ncbi:protein-L-isoaspartate(D-aspartate) O-methyltransferase [Inmirania thermothiophila]|uniref:Protein-L-isoaspartate O-methyltransferase n=1 Tax=Inmirania thermothiophila TaxID=1750597 RepID=A0A3N1Y7Z7_9GAMM|nr:protein-L-isoaspartate(D-aspartate) O-methyltransferase [Inmirania thermothiophila]ROR34895.1 protein-L-isoaspartate(D-aspartate) O-methyltransferase [Inmirania thermothiophila]
MTAPSPVERLIAAIEEDAARTAHTTGVARIDPAVLEAIRRVPRERFVPAEQRGAAYANHPLPIGEGQTISQPFIVALMTHLLGVGPGDRVLDVGTGSGYQAAVLAELGAEVYGVELRPRLAEEAAERLRALGYDHVAVRIGDGALGWPEHAPYRGIVVAAATPHVPPALLDQLAPRGRMVLPLGPPGLGQMLTVVERGPEGGIHQREVLPVAFVPLTTRG